MNAEYYINTGTINTKHRDSTKNLPCTAEVGWTSPATICGCVTVEGTRLGHISVGSRPSWVMHAHTICPNGCLAEETPSGRHPVSVSSFSPSEERKPDPS